MLIEKYAFYGCRSLRVVWLPMGLEIIEESAFSDCTALRQLLFPSSV
ncbi:MAG: leucine-rich repeat protein, partial [Selenomonadales bacterium]|nr:leucine-rich repeat protein [Selenomonadales bacterium]